MEARVSVSYIRRLSRNEGQCFLCEGPYNVSVHFYNTLGKIKRDKTSQIFINKMLLFLLAFR